MPAVRVLGDVGPHALSLRPLSGLSAITPQCLFRLEAASRLPGESWINTCVLRVGEELRALRSDIVVTHEPSRTIVVIDVTVSFEYKFDSLQSAGIEKIHIYQLLAETLRRRGYIVHVDDFVVGVWHSHNNSLTSLLQYATLMSRRMFSETIAWPRDVHVEHISGIRQYRVIGSIARDEASLEITQTHASVHENQPATDANNLNVDVSEAMRAQPPSSP
ncbi:unnamed protein product [Heterotrigona itama]|uniref:Reverse transcriptase domain-containing protein n=1 Tax=Heterotrigona itama TaxID=395501 RepID=A0A6V7GXR5_9HYME|nr:unnamed protein product [Heterotrigona itama]